MLPTKAGEQLYPYEFLDKTTAIKAWTISENNIFSFLSQDILLSNKWTLVNQKIRLDI